MAYKEVTISAYEARMIIEQWLETAIIEGGGYYGEDFMAWYPLIKKIAPPEKYNFVAEAIKYLRPMEAQAFLEYVGLE